MTEKISRAGGRTILKLSFLAPASIVCIRSSEEQLADLAMGISKHPIEGHIDAIAREAFIGIVNKCFSTPIYEIF